MYKLQLKESYFPAQNDAVIRDITVGELLRNISQSYPNNTALVDISDDGTPLKSWTYKELYETLKDKDFSHIENTSVHVSTIKKQLEKDI